MIWIICILGYLVSIYINWLYLHIAHSKRGIWAIINPERKDFIVCFIPGINTLTGIFSWFDWPIKSDKNYNKFFRIKK